MIVHLLSTLFYFRSSHSEGHKASEKHRSSDSRSHHKHSERSTSDKQHVKASSDKQYERASNDKHSRSSADRHGEKSSIERHGEKSSGERQHKVKKTSVGVQCNRDKQQADQLTTTNTASGSQSRHAHSSSIA